MKPALLLSFPIAALCGVSALAGYKIGQHHPKPIQKTPIVYGNVEMQPWLEPIYRDQNKPESPLSAKDTVFEVGKQRAGSVHHETYLNTDLSCGGNVKIVANADNGSHLVLACLAGSLSTGPECRMKKYHRPIRPDGYWLDTYWDDVNRQFPELPFCEDSK